MAQNKGVQRVQKQHDLEKKTAQFAIFSGIKNEKKKKSMMDAALHFLEPHSR